MTDMRTIPNFPQYNATDDGRVWSQKSNKFLKPSTDTDGYKRVILYREAKPYTRYVHRLVAQAFLPEPAGDNLTVDHENNNSGDNHKNNLSWMPIKDNIVKQKARCYKLRNPDGHMVEIFNLAEYCRDFGLDKSNLYKVIKGLRYSHKGYSSV